MSVTSALELGDADAEPIVSVSMSTAGNIRPSPLPKPPASSEHEVLNAANEIIHSPIKAV